MNHDPQVDNCSLLVKPNQVEEFSPSGNSQQDTVTNEMDLVEKKENFFQKTLEFFSPGSIGGSIVTLFIGVVGAGIVSVPLSFYNSGIILSILCYMLGGFFTYTTCVWLVESAQRTNTSTYMQVANLTCGKYLRLFIKINYMINCWGYTVAYCVIINKVMARSMIELLKGQSSIPNFLIDENGQFYSTVLIIFIVFPLSIRRQLTGMSYLGVLSFFISIYIFGIIIYNSSNPIYNPNGDNVHHLQYFKINGFWLSTPTAIFSFTCQQNVLDLKHELKKGKNHTNKKELKYMRIIFASCFLLVLTLYSLIGYFGYLTFDLNPERDLADPKLGGIVLMAYTDFNAGLIIGSMVLVVTQTFTLVFCYKPTKDCIFQIFQEDIDYEKIPMKKQALCIGLLCLLTIACTYIFKSLTVLIVILGAVQGPVICFILPAYFYYQLFKKELTLLKKLYIIFIYGVLQFVIMIMGVRNYFTS